MPSEYPECAHMKYPNMDVCVCVCVCVYVCVREVVELGLWPAGWHNHGSEQFRVSHSAFVEWHGNEPCITQHGLGMRLHLTVYGCGLKSKGGISGSEGRSFTAKSITTSNFIVYIIYS